MTAPSPLVQALAAITTSRCPIGDVIGGLTTEEQSAINDALTARREGRTTFPALAKAIIGAGVIEGSGDDRKDIRKTADQLRNHDGGRCGCE